MSFLRFPMFQRGGNIPAAPPPCFQPPLPGARRAYHSDSPNGPWEEVKEGVAFKRYVLYAPKPPSPQPEPAPLWRQMKKAFDAAYIDSAQAGYSAEIEAVAEWLKLNSANSLIGGGLDRRDIRLDERIRLCNLLKEQARIAHEGNA